MAAISFFIYDLDGVKQAVKNIISFEISQDIDAACDGLRISFVTDNLLNEVQRIEAYCDGRCIFNGYCDTQREQAYGGGFECFVYARSSACLLVDNEATPLIYNAPSTAALFAINAQEYGFENGLDMLYCEEEYQVSKGTSCFGAINDFVCGLTGRGIAVSPENRLIVAEGNSKVSLDEYSVISAKRIINRGAALSRLDYRADNEHGYVYHMKSEFIEGRSINRSRLINLVSMPKWQRDFVAINKLMSACSNYNTFEIVLDGCMAFELYSKVEYSGGELGKFDDYYISACTIISDKNGERTRLILNKDIDLKEVSYVAE